MVSLFGKVLQKCTPLFIIQVNHVSLFFTVLLLLLLLGQDPDAFFSSNQKEANDATDEATNEESIRDSYGQGTDFIHVLYFCREQYFCYNN